MRNAHGTPSLVSLTMGILVGYLYLNLDLQLEVKFKAPTAGARFLSACLCVTQGGRRKGAGFGDPNKRVTNPRLITTVPQPPGFLARKIPTTAEANGEKTYKQVIQPPTYCTHEQTSRMNAGRGQRHLGAGAASPAVRPRQRPDEHELHADPGLLRQHGVHAAGLEHRRRQPRVHGHLQRGLLRAASHAREVCQAVQLSSSRESPSSRWVAGLAIA